MTNRTEIERTLLRLWVQHPSKMSKYLPQLRHDMFTAERRLIGERLFAIRSDGLLPETAKAAMRNIPPSMYGGDGGIHSLFNETVTFTDALVNLHLSDLYELHARDICRTVGYSLVQEADRCSNPYLLADSARLDLITPMPGDTVRDISSIFSDMMSPDRQANTIRSHIASLDGFVGGFEPGELVIIAGNGGMGKTSVALHIFIQNVLNDVPMGFFSMEMQDTALYQRCCSMLLSIANQDIKKGTLTPTERHQLRELEQRLNLHRQFVNTKARNLRQMTNVIRAKAAEGYRAFIVDYLQLVTVEGKQSREQEVATIARDLKDAAMETESVVFALSQLNRDNQKRGNPRPKLSDLRESGEIEQASDFVLFPFRPMYFTPEQVVLDQIEQLEIIIGKGRTSGVGSVTCEWMGKYTQIRD